MTSASFPFAVRSLCARARARGTYLRIITLCLQKRAAGTIGRSTDQSDLHISCTHDSEPRIRRYPRFEMILSATHNHRGDVRGFSNVLVTHVSQHRRPSALLTAAHTPVSIISWIKTAPSRMTDRANLLTIEDTKAIFCYFTKTFRSINSIIIFHDS